MHDITVSPALLVLPTITPSHAIRGVPIVSGPPWSATSSGRRLPHRFWAIKIQYSLTKTFYALHVGAWPVLDKLHSFPGTVTAYNWALLVSFEADTYLSTTWLAYILTTGMLTCLHPSRFGPRMTISTQGTGDSMPNCGKSITDREPLFILPCRGHHGLMQRIHASPHTVRIALLQLLGDSYVY